MIKTVTILKENKKRLSIRFCDKDLIYFNVSIGNSNCVVFASTDINKAIEYFKNAPGK